MAEIYRIGSDDLIDRVSTFGGTNLMRASGCDDWDAQWYSTTQGFEFMGDRVKVPGGKNFTTSSYTVYDRLLPISYFANTPLMCSVFIYENTLTSTNNTDKITLECTSYYIDETYGNWWYTTRDTVDLNTIGLANVKLSYNSNFKELYGMRLSINTTSATSGYLIVGPRKIEMGTKPTDWTPSPYDLVTYNSSSESLVFFQ